jgi:protein involved in polysaccharide export with SLBB domain
MKMRTEPNPIQPQKAIRVTAGGAMLLAMFSLLLGACQTPTGMVSYPATSEHSATSLQEGDIIKIRFPSAPELDETQKIREDGKINLPTAGEIEAAGKTPGDLQDELEHKFKSNLTTDEVVVTLESSEMSVYVTGAVNKPGTIVFDRPMTVLQAIMESGGFSYVANMGGIHLIRQSDGEHKTELLDLRGALAGKPIKVVYLKAGDIIYVPEKAFNF